MWQPRSLTSLWASTAYYRASFAFLYNYLLRCSFLWLYSCAVYDGVGNLNKLTRFYRQFESISYILKAQNCCDGWTYLHSSDTQEGAKRANELQEHWKSMHTRKRNMPCSGRNWIGFCNNSIYMQTSVSVWSCVVWQCHVISPPPNRCYPWLTIR
jgi:hypothetical protein